VTLFFLNSITAPMLLDSVPAITLTSSTSSRLGSSSQIALISFVVAGNSSVGTFRRDNSTKTAPPPSFLGMGLVPHDAYPGDYATAGSSLAVSILCRSISSGDSGATRTG
jgi:hypothetical protein